METIKLKAHIGSDAVLKFEMPTNFKDIDAEIVLVLQPATPRETDTLGWPIAYFEAIDAIEADDVFERAE